MQWCSEVYITGEFASFFYVAFDSGVLGILRGWERSLYKWFVEGGAFLRSNSRISLQRKQTRKSFLSGVKNVCVGGIFLSYAPYFVTA